MKFVCYRTSTYNGDERPCEEAVSELVVETIRLTELKPSVHPEWFETGTNFRVEDGFVCKDIERVKWVVALVGLDSFMAFVAKYNPVVVHSKDGYNSIEIYDDYRE
jgi:hypothetical protein